MENEINFLQSVLGIARRNGWADSRLSITLSEDANQPLHVSYAMLTPRSAETELDAIYISQTQIETGDRESILSRIPTLEEYKTKKLLELVSTAAELSADLGLPADFLNPLTLMAEQLRTNILPRPTLEEELQDGIPY